MPTFISNDVIAVSSDGIDYCCYNIIYNFLSFAERASQYIYLSI